jgi:mono/diheme cytochrome c family protein
MLPTLQDAKDGVQAFGYNLGLAKSRPRLPRYSFDEKMEYWALIWGLVVMSITGFMLWNPISVTKLLPGVIIPAAKAAHGGEAVLAVLAIIIWHFYNVHLRHWNWAMVTGKLTRKEMEEEHPRELEAIEQGQAVLESDNTVIRKRQRVYFPVASVLAVVMLFGIYRLTSLEKTAITTLPPAEQQLAIYAPQTPTPMPTSLPTPTSAPQAASPTPSGLQSGTPAASLAWDNGIGQILKDKCGTCHGAMGGLSLATYADALKGGTNGEVIVAKQPDNSNLVKVQKAGGHPGQLSSDELSKIIAWIAAGAPEKAGAASSGGAAPTPVPALTWATGIDQLFRDRCTGCHGSLGGFSAASYSDVMKGSAQGPAIIAKDADNSPLVKLQAAGGHPGQFSPDELAIIKAWIAAGALEK